MYRLLFSLVLSRMDPEAAHHLAFRVIRLLPTLGFGRLVERFTRPDPASRSRRSGLTFPSPFGVAAGFDKDAIAVRGLGQLGFGHVEVGTITAVAQPGNRAPRLFRLIDDRALINRMGFNNGGADAAVGRLSRLARRRHRPVLGVNIGKSRVTPSRMPSATTCAAPRLLAPLRRLPRGEREFAEHPRPPRPAGARRARARCSRRSAPTPAEATPLLVKIAPDLDDEEVVRIGELVARARARRHHRHEHHDLTRRDSDAGIRGRAHRRRRPLGRTARGRALEVLRARSGERAGRRSA